MMCKSGKVRDGKRSDITIKATDYIMQEKLLKNRKRKRLESSYVVDKDSSVFLPDREEDKRKRKKPQNNGSNKQTMIKAFEEEGHMFAVDGDVLVYAEENKLNIYNYAILLCSDVNGGSYELITQGKCEGEPNIITKGKGGYGVFISESKFVVLHKKTNEVELKSLESDTFFVCINDKECTKCAHILTLLVTTVALFVKSSFFKKHYDDQAMNLVDILLIAFIAIGAPTSIVRARIILVDRIGLWGFAVVKGLVTVTFFFFFRWIDDFGASQGFLVVAYNLVIVELSNTRINVAHCNLCISPCDHQRFSSSSR